MPDPVAPEMPVAVPGAGSSIEDHEGMDAKLGHLMSEIVKDTTLDKAAKRKKVMTVLDLQDEGDMEAPKEEMEDEGDSEREKEEEEKEKKEEEKMDEAICELRKSTDPKLKELAESMSKRLADKKAVRKELDALKAVTNLNKRREKAQKLCDESALPKTCITPVLVEQMAARKTEKGMRALLEDRLAVVNVKRPTSSAGWVGRKDPKTGKDGVTEPSTKDFVESLNAH